MDQQFKYDVAFSFLSQDETTAQQISDELQGRFQTFIYSERQKQLAGTDGEETFKKVFASESRIVAVLYRSEWGSTPWTRVEQTAIRDRAHDEGYDFCTFIAMTEPVERPAWLPKTRLLFGLKRFHVMGAAAVLEARIQEQDGTVSEETVVERAQRLRRKQELSSEAERFSRSEEGVKTANAAVETLSRNLKRHADELKNTGLNLDVRELQMGNHVVKSPNAVLLYWWECNYANSLDGAKLHAEFYDTFPRLPGIMVVRDARTLKKDKFEFKLVGPDRSAWVSGDIEVAADNMADYLLKGLMQFDEIELNKKRR